jgi:hypothetical protein
MALTKNVDLIGIRYVKTDDGDKLFVDELIKINDGDTMVSNTITSKSFVRGDNVSAEDNLVKQIFAIVFN